MLVDKAVSNFISADTIWFKEKINVVDIVLLQIIPAATSLKNIHFNDTLSYELLYVYRPRKFAGCLCYYLIYFNDNAMYFSKNKIAYIFKILKE